MGRSQQLKRALILLALGSFACKPAPARELAGEAPPFHDQRIYESMLDATIEPDAMPALLPVDVRGDAIHVGRFDNTLIFRRGGSTELEERDNAVPVRVPGSDELVVWYARRNPLERRIFAARSGQLDRSWPVLDYVHTDAISEPIVVGDRVAVVTTHGIAYAPILGGAPGLLALNRTPVGLLSSDAGRLVWIARQGGREFVVSTDSSFIAETVEYEHPQRQASLVGAALVGGSIVFAGVDRLRNGTFELVVRRKRADGSIIELLREPAPGDELRLLADGSSAWLYSARGLRWIGADSHAKITGFEATASAIGADDGLLLWQSEDGLHVAGQPTVEFRQPFSWRPAVGGDDDDVWAGLTGNIEVGSVDSADPTPPGRVTLGRSKVDGGLDADIVRRIVRAHVPEIRSCYRAGLQGDSSLAGTIELEFVINESGQVAKVEDRTGDDFADHHVSRCVARALRRWKFPKPRDGGSVTVRYPLGLAPGQ